MRPRFMPFDRTLAAAFEDEIVILDANRGSLLLLDAWAAMVWRSCGGSAPGTTVGTSDEATERVRETLHTLEDAGLVRRVGGEWIRSPVEWV